jgi:hypothetical protein
MPISRVQSQVVDVATDVDPSLDSTKPCATKNHALLAVPTAILAALRHYDDFRAAIVEAISLGGDTDTVAAIAGAIVGARLGVESIPAELREAVIARDQIEMRARALVGQPKDESWEHQLGLERRLTLLEAEHWCKYIARRKMAQDNTDAET